MECFLFSVDNSVESWDNVHERWWRQKSFLTAGSTRNSVDDSVDESVDDSVDDSVAPWNHEAECRRGQGVFWMAASGDLDRGFGKIRPKIRPAVGQKLGRSRLGNGKISARNSVDDSVDPWKHGAEFWRGQGMFWMADSANPRPKNRKSLA